MRRSLQEQLLREYVRSILTEDDFGGGSFAGTEDFTNTFVGPVADAIGTVIGKTKEITRKARTAVTTGVKTALTTLIPFYSYSYKELFDKEKKDIKKIRDQYKAIYDRTDKALASNDAALLAFMASPAAYLVTKSTEIGAKGTKSLLSVMTGGLSDEIYDDAKAAAEKAGNWTAGISDTASNKASSGGPSGRFDESQLREADNDTKVTPRKILKSRKFIDQALKAPVAQEMQQQAREIYRGTLQAALDQVESFVKKTNTIEDLERITKGKMKSSDKVEIDKIKKLSPEEKKKAEQLLIQGMRKATKEFYAKGLEDQVKQVIAAGIPEDSQYVKDYRSTIQKIKSL